MSVEEENLVIGLFRDVCNRLGGKISRHKDIYRCLLPKPKELKVDVGPLGAAIFDLERRGGLIYSTPFGDRRVKVTASSTDSTDATILVRWNEKEGRSDVNPAVEITGKYSKIDLAQDKHGKNDVILWLLP